MRYCLNESEIHVWRACAGSVPSRSLQPLLTPEEINRANRYFFPGDRENFIVSRGILRVLIGQYLTVDPAKVNLFVNCYGKPYLKKSEGNLNFNVSHSRGNILFAFALNREVGIDIEFMRQDFSYTDIARHFFSDSETLALLSLPEDLRKRGFFSCWTRKEAYIKAKGKGLSIPLASFDVSVCPGDGQELLLNVHADPEETKRWKIINLDVEPDYCAALATEGNTPEINYLYCSGEIIPSLLRPEVIRLQKTDKLY